MKENKTTTKKKNILLKTKSSANISENITRTFFFFIKNIKVQNWKYYKRTDTNLYAKYSHQENAYLNTKPCVSFLQNFKNKGGTFHLQIKQKKKFDQSIKKILITILINLPKKNKHFFTNELKSSKLISIAN